MELISKQSMSEEKSKSISRAIQDYGRKLFGFIRGRVKTDEDAEDILQDAWFQLSSLNNLTDLGNVSAWLYQVAGTK